MFASLSLFCVSVWEALKPISSIMFFFPYLFATDYPNLPDLMLNNGELPQESNLRARRFIFLLACHDV